MSKEENTLDSAKKIVQQEQTNIVNNCQKEIAEVLKKYNCSLEVTPTIIINGRPQSIKISINDI